MVSTPQDYGDLIQGLIDEAELPPLGPGSAYSSDTTVRDRLAALDTETLFAGRRIVDHDMAACCFSALLLLHNDLDASHTVSQSIKSAEGSYWHGIMHRREPDFPNAKYWFNRVGQHPVFEQLPATASALNVVEFDELRREWDPYRFIDLCEQAIRKRSPELTEACRSLAQSEWLLLFDYCFRRAIDG